MGNKLFRKITSVFTTIATVITLSGFNFAMPVFAAVMDSQVADGDLIRATGDIKVYIADKRGNTWYKRWLVGPQIFDFYGHFGQAAWGKIKEVSPAFRDAAIETNLVQVAGDEKVWRLDNCTAGIGCTKRWIKNAATFTGLGYDWGSIRTINEAEANWHTTGAEIDTTGQQQTGNLTVALAADNPVGVTLPLGATRVELLKFTVSGSGTVNSVAVQRYGAGSASDFNNVYLYDGNTRLTTGRSINSTTHMVNFTGLNLAVNGSKTLTVVGDFTSSSSFAGNVDGFRINSASDVGASTTVGGNFPIVGNLFSTTAATVGSITIARSGSLTNPKVGETNAKVAEFQLTAGSSEDVDVQSITLFQVGNISRSNLTNFVLKQGGATLATASALNSSDRVVLTFSSPLNIPKGGVRTLELFADVGSNARSGDTIRFYLETNADLYAVGKTYGYGTTVTSTNYDNSANDGTDASWTQVDAGQVTIAFSGPSTTDYSVQQQDVELFRFNITSQNNIEIRNTRLTLIAGGADADEDSDAGGLVNGTASVNYTDIKFVDATTGAVVVGPRDLSGTAVTDDDSQSLVFTDVWNVNANQTRTIKVTADVANYTPASNETITARLDAFQASDIKNLDNNLFVATSSIVPSGNITGNAHNIKTASLTTSLAGTPTAQTYINGSKDIALTGINLQAGTGKDVKVTSIMLTAVGANSCATETDCVLTVKLFDGTTQIGDTKSLTSSNTATFSNLSLLINKGTTKTIVARVDLNTLSSVSSGTTLRLDVASAGDITAQDLDGNTVANSGTVTGPAHTITGAGTLTAALAPDEIDVTDAHNIIAGKSDVTLAKIRFTAANEQLKIVKLRIKVASGTLDEITGLTLWDGSSKVADTVVPNSSLNADFNSWLADFIVPKDNSKILTVKGNLNTISGGADSGAQVSVTLDFDDNFEARGVGTNTVVTSVGSSDITGRTMIVRKTVPTVTLLSLPSSTLVSGTNTLLRFRIAADSTEQVSVKKLGFTVSYSDIATSTNLTVSSPAIREVGAGSDIAGTSFITTDTADTTQTLTVRIEFTSEQAIAAGGYKDYDLRATVSNVGPSDQISTKLDSQAGVDDTENPGNPAATIYVLRDEANNNTTLLELDPDIGDTGDGLDSYFIWSDNSAVPHNDTVAGASATTTTGSADWIHGYKVRTIPTDSKVLISPSS